MHQKGLLLNNFQRLLGSHHEYKNDIAFHCPFCHHHKKKLNINLENQKWHCWVCNAKGRKFIHLLRKINAPNDITNEILKNIGEYKSYNKDKNKNAIYEIALPKSFNPLWKKHDDIIYKHAIKYLNKRNIGERDIIRYGIGYCSDGKYENRIIIPSYDKDGKLNYFVARDIFPNSKFKYKNPNIPKDTVIFELFINWDKPIILCEGVFDAIAIKRNAIPLLGKFMSKTLVKRIIQNKVEKVYMSLDQDAKKDSIKLSKFLMDYGIKTYRIDLKEKDPSELGFVEFWNLIKNTQEYSFSQSIRERLYD
jgi:DNA primase|tara:strand:- start:1682 stop:2602 length:921 start_codon:yes stop_codon:yes gene_type:complete